MQIMGDLIKFAHCLLCVSAVVLTPFAVMSKRNITMNNRYTMARRIMLATGPLALISTCLAAYVAYLNSEMGECNDTASFTPSPKSDNNMMQQMICTPMSARLMVIACYVTFLMSIVVAPANWKRISFMKTIRWCCAPLLVSMVSLIYCFLITFWLWVMDAAERKKIRFDDVMGEPSTYILFLCGLLFASWASASYDTYYEGVRTRAEINFKSKRDGLVTRIEHLRVMRDEMQKEIEKDNQWLKHCFCFWKWKNHQGPPPPPSPPVVVAQGEEQV